MKKKILLTGAGFTHNFGLPLARQVWGMIFNDPSIQSTKKVRGALLKTFNYEDLYSQVLTQDKYQCDKKPFLNRISEVFNDTFEELCIQSINNEQKYGIKFNDIRKFIKLFSGKDGNLTPYIFSLNQDLFLERVFMLNNEMLFSPFLGSCLWNFNPCVQQQAIKMKHSQLRALNVKDWDNKTDGIVPSGADLKFAKAKFDINAEGSKRDLPFYIKMHGSVGWRYKDDGIDMPLVMGTGKKEQISNHPLLDEYYKIFEKTILENETDLLVIGYSFSDGHINKLLSSAIEKKILKIHIVNPQPVDKFKSMLEGNAKKHARHIYSCLGGYYEGTLRDLFPYVQNTPVTSAIQSTTLLWEQLNGNFFKI
jgi:hypothetical protein